jgi:hypothetical protein
VPIGTPNCLRAFRCRGDLDQCRHRTDRLGADGCDRALPCAHDQGVRAPRLANPAGFIDANVVQHGVGSVSAVVRRVGRERTPGAARGTRNSDTPSGEARIAVLTGRNEQVVRGRGVNHDGFAAVDAHLATLVLRGRAHAVEVVAVARLLVLPGEQLLAAHDLRQQFVPLARRAGLRDQVGAHDRCRHVRFDQQPAAELLHDDHRVDRSTAETTEGFRHTDREHADAGECPPDLGAAAVGRLQDRPPPVERVFPGHETRHRVLQLPLFVGEAEIHRYVSARSVRGPASCAR